MIDGLVGWYIYIVYEERERKEEMLYVYLCSNIYSAIFQLLFAIIIKIIVVIYCCSIYPRYSKYLCVRISNPELKYIKIRDVNLTISNFDRGNEK